MGRSQRRQARTGIGPDRTDDRAAVISAPVGPRPTGAGAGPAVDGGGPTDGAGSGTVTDDRDPAIGVGRAGGEPSQPRGAAVARQELLARQEPLARQDAAASAPGALAIPDQPTAPPGPTPEPSADRRLEVPRTRTSSTWAGVAAVLVLLILIIDFIVQNLKEASLHFLGAHFRLPIGIIALSAAVAGGVVVLLVGVARLAQLRLMARRHRKGR